MIKSLITRNSTRIRGANTNLTLVRFAGHSNGRTLDTTRPKMMLENQRKQH